MMECRSYGLRCVCVAAGILVCAGSAWADGTVRPPRDYKGSLEEQAQEAIVIFTAGEKKGDAREDLILKISVKGNASRFAWIIPFPSKPEIAKEDPKLFKELFQIVPAGHTPILEQAFQLLLVRP